MAAVSIIVPCYNHAPFLQQRLDSILNQTFQDYEIILLDDHSTDGSAEILQQYSNHPRVSHFVVNKKNGGNPFLQWQKGIDLAKGQFVWIAESDDTSDIHFLEMLAAKLIADERIGLAYCRSQVIDADGNRVENKSGLTDNLDISLWKNDFILESRRQIDNNLFLRNFIANASAVLFRKNILTQSEWNAGTFRYVGDWWAWYAILRSSSLFYFAQAYNSHRNHLQTTRTKKNTLPYIIEKIILYKMILDTSVIDRKNKEIVFNRLANRLVSTHGVSFLLLSRVGLTLSCRITKMDYLFVFRVIRRGISKRV